MIRRVRLERWKAFLELDQELPEGTSFVVAENGVGKTSLLQALHFGLYGDRRLLGSGAGIEHAVRGNGKAARVLLDVDLDGVAWTIDRSVPPLLDPGHALPEAVISADGVSSTEALWRRALVHSAGVSIDYLRLLSAIGEGDSLRPNGDGQYDLVKHLSDVLGVSTMQVAATVLRSHARAVARTADSERLDRRDRPARLAQREYAALVQKQTDGQRRLEESRARLEELNAELTHVKKWREWEDVHRGEASRDAAYVRAVEHSLGEALESSVVDAAWIAARTRGRLVGDYVAAARSLEEEVRTAGREVSERLGAVGSEMATAEAALEDLRGNTARCPTCLRPLSGSEAARASSEHRAKLEGLRREEVGLRGRLEALNSLQHRTTALVVTAGEIRTTPAPGEPPEAGLDLDALQQAVAEQLSAVQSADNAVRDFAASLRAQNAILGADAADEALSRRLEQQYREADLATLAAETMDDVAKRICAEQIAPLAHALAKRWLQLWPGRPAVGLDIGSGRVFAEHESTRLDVSDLSGGERTVASVLLRLLALQAASRSPILLLDEPLEHLDPRNRRMLAGVLVAAGSGDSAPRQILVTTYEESVTRRLNAATGSPSNVIYIRQESLS